MKKILFVFICLFFLPTFVMAEEGIERRYRFYYLDKVYSKSFYEEGIEVDEYPFKSDIYVYDTNIKESFDKPEIEEDIVKEIKVVKYKEAEKVKYVMASDFLSGQSINIQEVEVFSGDDKLDYKFWCDHCSNDFIARIQNNISNFEYNYIKGGEKMIFELEKECFPDDLRIVFHFGGNYGNDVTFSVRVNNTKDWSDKYYFYKVNLALNFYAKHDQKLNMIDHEERWENEVKEGFSLESTNNLKIIDEKTKYQYKLRLYQHYKENKVYVDGYYLNLPGLIKDEDNYVDVEKDKSDVITEYIEKEVIVPNTIIEEIPVVEEKIKYLTDTKVEYVEVPKEVSKVEIKEVEVPVKNGDNYFIRYFIYLAFFLCLKKMSIFKV